MAAHPNPVELSSLVDAGASYARDVPYTRSMPLLRWETDRQVALGVLADAHAVTGEVGGRGRPLEIGRPLGHAYVLRLVAEFQAFVRDLHDLTAERLVDVTQALTQFRPKLIAAVTEDRGIDRGNATVRTIVGDFRRLGVSDLGRRLADHNRHWNSTTGRGDQAYFGDLMRLRNALAHGNQTQLDRARADGIADTITWSRARLPMLRRIGRALDRSVWESLAESFGSEPW